MSRERTVVNDTERCKTCRREMRDAGWRLRLVSDRRTCVCHRRPPGGRYPASSRSRPRIAQLALYSAPFHARTHAANAARRRRRQISTEHGGLAQPVPDRRSPRRAVSQSCLAHWGRPPHRQRRPPEIVCIRRRRTMLGRRSD